jgi:hypothetical protein
VASVRGLEPGRRSRLEELKAQMRKPGWRRKQRREKTPYQSAVHCRDRPSELSCSIHERSANPSAGIDASSCGSRHALQPSSAHQGPCTPPREPRRTPATAGSLRTGVRTSLYGEYLVPEYAATATAKKHFSPHGAAIGLRSRRHGAGRRDEFVQANWTCFR